MKAFFVGLAVVIIALILSGIGVLLFPVIVLLGLFLRLIISVALVLFGIWLLGKLIIVVWEAIKEK